MPDHDRSSSRTSSSPRDLDRLGVAGPSAGWRAMSGCIRDRGPPTHQRPAVSFWLKIGYRIEE